MTSSNLVIVVFDLCFTILPEPFQTEHHKPSSEKLAVFYALVKLLPE